MLYLKSEKSPVGKFEKNILERRSTNGVHVLYRGGVLWINRLRDY